jgi:hypothetical protein
MTFEFISSFFDTYFGDAVSLVLEALDDSGAVIAIMPFQLSRKQIKGLSFTYVDRILSTYSTQGKLSA